MAFSKSSDFNNPTALIHKLCCHILKSDKEQVSFYFNYALRFLSSFAYPSDNDEFHVAEKIKKKMIKLKKNQDIASFNELHRKLQGCTIKNRWAVLCFLMHLTDSKEKTGKVMALSRHFSSLTSCSPNSDFTCKTSSQVNSIHSSTKTSSGFNSGDKNAQDSSLKDISNEKSLVNFTLGGIENNLITVPSRKISNGTISSKQDQLLKNIKENTAFEVPESVLIRDLLYVFQGIDGKIIKYDIWEDGYRIDPSIGISTPLRQKVYRLAEIGWLFNKIKKYCEQRYSDTTFGLVEKSFCTAMYQELTEYYRLIAVLEAQLQQEEELGISTGGLTLRRLTVWMWDPLFRLKTLACLVDVCQGKKGGELATVVHSYLQHGDPQMKALIKCILKQVSQPIHSMLNKWIYDGELEDPYHEFFIAADLTVRDERLWNDKYSLRKTMIPSYISMEQARKILLAGKSINFLRQVCRDHSPIKGRNLSKSSKETANESLFSQDVDGEFQTMIDNAYKDISCHLLNILHNKYKFMEHLKAMRRYLLLGQGDFIRHLMDLLEVDLAKPAGTLYLHNLTGILETAVRATNAQYDDPEILKRLDVRLLEVSPGDCGWDVFGLDYHVDGPISTVFSPECMVIYFRLFNFLWRAKRMEYILSSIWKSQMTNARILKVIPEMGPLLHHCHLLACEMFHFVQQAQYYITFEVMECSWDVLLNKVQKAKDLDDIIAAHEEFLDTIISRSLLDNDSKKILNKLRSIFDLIINFQNIQDAMYQSALGEVEARKRAEEAIRQRTEEGQWGTTEAEVQLEKKRATDFIDKLIPSVMTQLRVLEQTYQDMIQQFLVMLTSHSDVSLRFLSFRLDFNEHYKSKDSRLKMSLTYQHKRKSNF